jgi:hypothetical protein
MNAIDHTAQKRMLEVKRCLLSSSHVITQNREIERAITEALSHIELEGVFGACGGA